MSRWVSSQGRRLHGWYPVCTHPAPHHGTTPGTPTLTPCYSGIRAVWHRAQRLALSGKTANGGQPTYHDPEIHDPEIMTLRLMRS